MAQQFLDGAEVGPALQEVRGEGVPQRVRGGALGYGGLVQMPFQTPAEYIHFSNVLETFRPRSRLSPNQ